MSPNLWTSREVPLFSNSKNFKIIRISLRVSQVVLAVKNPPANAGDVSLIPGLGRSPGGGHGNPLQCSCLENPMDRGAGGLQSMGSQRVGHD